MLSAARRALLLAAAALAACAHAALLPVTERQALAPPDININCGGPAVGRFAAEDYAWIVGNTDQFIKADAVIGGAEPKNEPMYHSHRYGMQAAPWGYDIPVEKPGVYGCTAHFAETASEAFSSGARVFDLSMGGKGDPVVFKNVDVYNATGGAHFVVYTRTAESLVVTRTLKVRITRAAGSKHAGFIAGITCERTANLPAGVVADPSPTAVSAPSSVVQYAPIGEYTLDGVAIATPEININAGGKKAGRFSAEDPLWVSYGSTTTFGKAGHPIGGADPINLPALVDTRYGLEGATFGYQIPIAPAAAGIWDCTLHWAELVDSIKVGARVFDVQVQDQMVARFDVMAATNNAEFTSAVLTFEKIPISDVLVVKLSAYKGDPFLSAITCARSTAMTPAEAAAQIDVRATANSITRRSSTDAKPTVSPELKVSPGDFSFVPEFSLEPEPSTSPFVANTDPAPSLSVAPASSSPSASASLSVLPSFSSIPASLSPVPSSSPVPPFSSKKELIGEIGPDASDGPQPSSGPLSSVFLQDIVEDETPSPSADQVLQKVVLAVELPSGTQVDNKLKQALKDVIAKGSDTKADIWAMTNVEVASGSLLRMESTGPAKLTVDLNGVLSKNAKKQVNMLTEYVADGKATAELRNAGYSGSSVSLVAAPDVTQFNATQPASTSSASTIVAAVVGTLLGALLIVALLAFFVIHRHRRNEVNPAAFDAPPPAMEDSDGEAPSSIVHSGSAASVDYLDDDSTFTAATSRGGGDVEAGVTLDKDVWGRGSS